MKTFKQLREAWHSTIATHWNPHSEIHKDPAHSDIHKIKDEFGTSRGLLDHNHMYLWNGSHAGHEDVQPHLEENHGVKVEHKFVVNHNDKTVEIYDRKEYDVGDVKAHPQIKKHFKGYKIYGSRY
jgi:hypothetical protein